MEIVKEEKNVKIVKLTLEKAEVDKATEKIYSELSQSVKLKGFRPGRVPRNLLTTVVGKDKINNMIKEEIADKAVYELHADEEFKKLNLMLPPALKSIEINEGAELTFELHSYPKVEVGSISGEKIEVPKLKEEDLEKDVESELEKLREENAVLEPKGENEVVEIGDHVEVEYQVNDGEMKRFDFVVREPIDTELLKKIIGKKVGDTFEFTDDKAEEKTVYRVKVDSIHRRVLANLDDEFAKTVDEEAETLEALKSKLRGKIKDSFDDFIKTFKMNTVLERIANKTKLDITDHSLDLFVNHLIMRQKEEDEFQKALEEFDGNVKAYEESLKKEITTYLKTKLAVEEIAKEKGIEVSDEEIFNQIKEYYAVLNMSEERLKVMVSKDEKLRDQVKNELLHEKVAEELLKEIEIVEREEDKEEPNEEIKEDSKKEKEEEKSDE